MQQSQPPPKTGNRLRLDIQSQLPPYHMVDLAYTESKTRRGCLVEIPWRTKKPGQMFTLTCQWEDGAELPVWSLYEQSGEDSKMHWSKPFGSADLQLLYDMAAMAAVDADSTKIPDNLKAKESQKLEVTPPPQPSYVVQQPPGPPPSGSDFTQGTMPAYQTPYGGYPPPGYAMPQQMYPQQMPGYPPMPGYPQMPQQMYPGMPGMMPGMPGMPMPGMPGMPGDPNAWMQQGMQQGMQPGMAPGMMPGMPPMPQQIPPAPANQQSQAQTAITPLVGDSGVFKRIDMSLISKTQTLDIGTLLLNAHLIKQSTLEAALKIQGMVDDGKLDPEIAPAALERFHGEGSKIDTYLSGDVLEKMRDKAKQSPAAPPPKPAPTQASTPAGGAPGAPAADGKPAAPVKKGQKSPEEIQKIRNAFDLLKQAGIITDTDIQTAQTVLRKHGGDIVEILVSAGKFDKNTFEAAHIVRPLIDATLMKLEQAIIVLNYCCRSRVDFDTAIDEMGWQNPRKLRTDLNLEK